jgi:hypothetical protein
MVYFMVVFSRIFNVGFVEMLLPMAPALTSGLATYALLFVTVMFVDASFFWLVAVAALGTMVYLVLLHLFSRGRDLRDFLGLLWGAFPQRRGFQ